jgi:hypothetical protein
VHHLYLHRGARLRLAYAYSNESVAGLASAASAAAAYLVADEALVNGPAAICHLAGCLGWRGALCV